MGIHQRLATSRRPSVVWFRRLYQRRYTLVRVPWSRWALWCMVYLFAICRGIYYWLFRVGVVEPLFRGYFSRVGRRLQTGVYVPWVLGVGDAVAGDDVIFHGKFSLTFAHRYCAKPTLVIGDRTGIGHDCTIIVAKSVEIGHDCRISTGVLIFDSSGHATEPQARRRGDAAADRDVRPVRIGDNVWIGQRAIIFPGVHIGDNSMVTAGSVVMSPVPANVVVAGYPARQITKLVSEVIQTPGESADAELKTQN